jgi:D-lyxose ketol-isomerase
LQLKRSEINAILLESVRFIQEMRFCLPPFAYWRAEDWKQKGRQYDEIRENMLGWDITDFGEGDYTRVGLLMFTLRNGGA